MSLLSSSKSECSLVQMEVFNVLFTSRIKQKIKKWADGIGNVTYINDGKAKIRIVDESGEFVLSSIVGNSADIYDGNEIVIDGTLVQFGEKVSGNPDIVKTKPQNTEKNFVKPSVSGIKHSVVLRTNKNEIPKNIPVASIDVNPSKNRRSFGDILDFFEEINGVVKHPRVTLITSASQMSNTSDDDNEGTQRDSRVEFKAPTNIQSSESPIDSIILNISLYWEKKNFSSPPHIPIQFSSIDEYKDCLTAALTFELNVKIQEAYSIFYAAMFMSNQKAPRCPNHGNMAFFIDRKGIYYYRCNSPGCKKLIQVPPSAEIDDKKSITLTSSARTMMKTRGYPCYEGMCIVSGSTINIKFSSISDDKTEYSKDDLWVLFGEKISPFFCVSEHYGIIQGSKLTLVPFFSDIKSFPRHTRVNACRIYNAQTEKVSIIRLHQIDENLPIIDSLLRGGPSNPLPYCTNIDIYISELTNQFFLNSDQQNALKCVASFFGSDPKPVLLVHGIFGAGKSKFLTVASLFLDKVLTSLGMPDKVLIAATTNVAVDNVLSNLNKLGFSNFTRVGSVKKVRKELLPYLTGHGDADSLNELASLRNEFSPNEIEILESSLANAKKENEKHISRIDSTRIVGVTCAATSFSVMNGRKFPFVLLDECSQQTEPSSIIPISFGCARLICCGDPQQLPPTISKSSPNGLGKPLFSRLSTIYPPVILSTQYRCHPRISGICNKLFYQGRIKDGISEDDRTPLFGFPTICIFDIPHGQEVSSHSSVMNQAEATTCSVLVKYLISKGVDNHDIGVIAFYRSQVESISAPLIDGRKNKPIVDVSTVDAFQGDERDFIIISTAKTSASSFVESKERINVAISRAKRHLIVVTNMKSLHSSDLWSMIYSIASKSPNRIVRLEETPTFGWRPFE